MFGIGTKILCTTNYNSKVGVVTRIWKYGSGFDVKFDHSIGFSDTYYFNFNNEYNIHPYKLLRNQNLKYLLEIL